MSPLFAHKEGEKKPKFLKIKDIENFVCCLYCIEKEITKNLEEAERLFDRGEYEKALEYLGACGKAIAEKTEITMRKCNLLACVHYNKAIVMMQLGRMAGAFRELDIAINECDNNTLARMISDLKYMIIKQ